MGLYNALSLKHFTCLGGFDLATTGENLRLALTGGGEPFLAIGVPETERVAAGEVAYLDDDEVITRYFVWRQADKNKITENSTEVFLVSEVLAEAGPEVAEAVALDLAELVPRYLGGAVDTYMLSRENREITF